MLGGRPFGLADGRLLGLEMMNVCVEQARQPPRQGSLSGNFVMNRTALLLACLVAFGAGPVAEAVPAARLPGVQRADVLLSSLPFIQL